jgi:DNA-binding MarR family transcriptional regulator
MQFNILMTIRGMGEPTVSDLVRYIGIDQTTLTRSLQTIERRGWVERIAVPDRRMRAFRITAKGLAALRKAEPLWAEVQARTIDRLGAEAWERIRSPLTDLANARGEVRTLSKTAP